MFNYSKIQTIFHDFLKSSSVYWHLFKGRRVLGYFTFNLIFVLLRLKTLTWCADEKTLLAISNVLLEVNMEQKMTSKLTFSGCLTFKLFHRNCHSANQIWSLHIRRIGTVSGNLRIGAQSNWYLIKLVFLCYIYRSLEHLSLALIVRLSHLAWSCNTLHQYGFEMTNENTTRMFLHRCVKTR